MQIKKKEILRSVNAKTAVKKFYSQPILKWDIFFVVNSHRHLLLSVFHFKSLCLMVVAVLPDSFGGMEEEELLGDPTVGPRPKVWTRDQRLKK